MFAPTILVTPISPFVWWIGTLGGAAAGTRVGYQFGIRQPLLRADREPVSWRAQVILFVALTMPFGAFIGNRAVWRESSILLFWNSAAPISTLRFPIREVRQTRAGAVVSIGSAGEQALFSITPKDMLLLEGSRFLHRPWKHCLRLRRQVEGDAVRVWLSPHARQTTPGRTIVPCPADVAWI
ncbi:hypothetical protein [Sphingomonas prati]|uniref:Uncharacterized protein n=1 Tax=Sphingomonas prati TaxID=1843237 RepID=A0A7W9BPK8_9SPHN|nr:hypothetical protein [Sphingomonas prati]MBB5727821.1 hypothetical protein [Sphingomonas prati]